MNMKSASLLLLLCLPACGLQNMYEKEYTFYDPDGKEVEGPAGEEGKGDGEKVDGEKAEAEKAGDPAKSAAAAEQPAAAAAASDLPTGSPPASTGKAELDRLFKLEAVLDELNRAIRDGLDHDGTLARKRQAVELELAARKRAAGDSYGQERQRRIRSLREFKTQTVK